MPAVGSVLKEEPGFPAEMAYCQKCHLAQLTYAVDPNVLFPPDYPYTSGTTKVLRENFADLYKDVSRVVGLAKEDLIVDIGSNDGTLLSNFLKGGHRVLGIEPSLQAKKAEAVGIRTLMRFFDGQAVSVVKSEQGDPKVVTATNVFAHIPNVHAVMQDIDQLVGSEGVFITESHYLLDLVETLQYDTIYHEHLRYYSLASIKNLLEGHGFRVFSVKRIPSHGGSIRVYTSKSPRYKPDASVTQLLRLEEQNGLTSGAWIPEFRSRVARSKVGLYQLLGSLPKGSTVYGIGAPSRASTLINYVGLDDSLVNCVMEVPNSQKLNKYIPGTKIPVLDEAKLYQDQPSHVLLLSWHIAAELCENLKRRGYKGDFIVPLPEPRVIGSGDVVAHSLGAL